MCFARQILPSAVGLPVASIMLAVLIPKRLVVMLMNLTQLSFISAWGAAIIFKEVAAVALICAIVLFWQREDLSSIGLRKMSFTDIQSGIVTSALSILIPTLIHASRRNSDFSDSRAVVAALLALPLWFRLSGTLVNGVAEETILRGYAIERLTEIARSR